VIPVTKPFLPPIEEYRKYIADIWQRQWLTNNGPLVNELEIQLKQYLELDHLLYVSNGTIALQIAIKALDLRGEIITTPFSYVATTSSIVWEGCKPVFVDIDQATLNIDANKIEKAITSETTAIIATHVFGNPCEIERIESIAQKHNLKVIYDAAHAFGTKYRGKSIFAFGDISTSSFHATKLFHTIEGGMVSTNCPNLLQKMSYMRNFGHDGPDKFNGVGINGKNSEFHAAMGLCNLPEMKGILNKRKEQHMYYCELLSELKIKLQVHLNNSEVNFAYYPVIFENEKVLLAVKEVLEKYEIYPRRYFYPSLSKLNYVDSNTTPISDEIAASILCLPLYHDLSKEEQNMIAKIISRTIID
jgi:dTDP-4-amino-4,6-dideoxygalactose transaminase